MEFRVLGVVEVVVEGTSLDLGRRRERCVLGLLLLNLGSPLSVDRLVDLLWDDELPERPRLAIQVCISRLRADLAGAGVERHGFRLRTKGSSYLLEGDPARVDIHRFRELHDRARTVAEPRLRQDLLRQATALWRGPVLGDVATRPIRERIWPEYDEQILAVTELRVEADLDAGEHAGAVAELAVLTKEHPLRERLVELYMLALYRAGRRQDALSAYAETRRTLAEETGLDPRAELIELHRRILRSDPDLDLTAAAATAMVRPAQLPPAVADFIGRSSDVQRLDELMHTDGPVVINTISGSGGIGKTALAVHWAHRVREEFPDGQLYLNLHGYSGTKPIRPIAAVTSFLRALGVSAHQIPYDLEEASSLYRSMLADRRILVVLDNANSPDQVRPLLPGTSGSLALITSRDQMSGLVAVDGARRLTLDTLSAKEAIELLVRVIGADRVAAEPDAAAELTTLCGYLPLAVRITGALLADRPARTIATHVAELRDGNRLAALGIAGDERASVRVAFDQSYQQLPADERRLFRLLGLVPGLDFTAAAAAALADVPADVAAALLERLAEGHLIERTWATGRYAFHDLLGEYSRRRGAADDEPTTRATATLRLYEYYLAATDAAARRLYPTALRLTTEALSDWQPDAPAAQSWLETERANLVAAIVAAAGDGNGPIAWALADALRTHFYIDRYTVDWIRVAHSALSAATEHGDARAQVTAYLSLGLASNHLNRLDEGITHFTAGLAAAKRAGWLHGEVSMLNSVGITYMMMGRLREAHTALDAALTLLLEMPGAVGRGVVASNIGLLKHHLGDSDDGLRYLQEALILQRQDANINGEADVNRKLGTVHLDHGRPDAAIEHARAALALISGAGGRLFETDSLNLLGAAYLVTGALPDAVDNFECALRLGTEIDDRYAVGEALLGLAHTEMRYGRLEPAFAHAGQALGIARDGGYHQLEGDALASLAELRIEMGDLAGARKDAESALAVHEVTGIRRGIDRARAAMDRSS